MDKYLNEYVDALRTEFGKYVIALKKLPEIDYSTFFTSKNLLALKDQFCGKAKTIIDGVNWNDKIIVMTTTVHVILLLNIIQDRKSFGKQVFYVLLLTLLSFSSGYLNKLGSENWKKLGSKNYFDKDGSFMLLFLNIPAFIELLLCLCIICVLSFKTLCCSEKPKPKKTKPAKKQSIKKSTKQEPKKPVNKEPQSKGNVKKPLNVPKQKFN